MAGRRPLVHPDQHVERAGQPGERRQHGDEHDHCAECRHVLPDQLLWSREQVRSALDAGGFDAHQVRRAHDDQQHECGCGQGDDVVEAMRTGAAQCCRTAHASCGHSRCQGRDRLEQSAARALSQLRLGLRPIGGRSHHRPNSIAVIPSASWPTAVLIAVTSPGTPGAGGGTEKRKLRNTGGARPLKLTLA